MLGRVDGSAALVDDRGFVFLFNPNYRELHADFPLDARIGLTKGEKEMLEDLVLVAVREAQQKAADLAKSEMSKLTGGLNLPFKLPL